MDRRIIVNADDLGASLEVDAAIFELIERGRITSATLLANGPTVENATLRSARFPRASFGIHLNASEFNPLAPTPGLSSILTSTGTFAGNRLRELGVGKSLRAALFVEWSSQVQRLLDLGVRVSHLDSHHHMHTVPGVFPVIKALQARFGIRRVRASMNVYSRTDPPRSRGLLAKKALWNAAMRFLGSTTMTRVFTSLEVFCQAAHEGRLPGGATELMVHPGNPAFAGEWRMLEGDWERSLPFSVRLINYRDL